jgi:hypothetical protein
MRPVPTYRLHDAAGDHLGVIEHPAPNVEPGDVFTLPDIHNDTATPARSLMLPG